MANVRDVARVFAYLADRDEGKPIEVTRLNKLLYFAQGHALVELGRPLFDNQIDAWEHGPVVAVVYTGFNKILDAAREHGISDVRLTPDELEIITDVWDNYSVYRSGELVNLTHMDNTPWSETYVPGIKNVHIPVDRIAQYFSRPEQRLNITMSEISKLPSVTAMPADEYDPDEDAVWEALLNDGK